MALPVTYYETFLTYPHPKPGFEHLYSLYDLRKGYRQAKPIDGRPLYYFRDFSALVNWAGHSQSASEWFVDDVMRNDLAIIAYDRLKDKFSDRASLGVTLAEVSQTWEMLHGRIAQLATFTKQLNRFDVIGASRTLGLTAVPKGVTRRKQLADNYLEFHFGWSPLVNDIYALCDVLQSPFKDVEISGSAKTWEARAADYGFGSTRFYDVEWLVRYGARVRITNPNLWLLNQSGLLNPFGLLVEVTPFSFVLDWVVNLNQFVGMLTDWVGLDLIDEYTTWMNKASGNSFIDFPSGYEDQFTGFVQYRIRRVLGISQPTLGFRAEKPWHWRRLAAAASLLVQQTHRIARNGR